MTHHQSLVDEFVERLCDARDCWASGWNDDHSENVRRDVLRMMPAVQTVAAALDVPVDPADLEPVEGGWEFSATYEAALRLQGAIQYADRAQELIARHSPQLSAEQFHEWTWQPAADLWRDGYHRNAIHAAAAHVETRLQAKLQRDDVSGVALIREAFSLKSPEPGKARLRFAWLSPGGEAHRSRHEGASAFGAGVFQLIRNSAAHQPTKLVPEIALEHLAALSYLARLIDAATVDASESSTDAPERPFG